MKRHKLELLIKMYEETSFSEEKIMHVIRRRLTSKMEKVIHMLPQSEAEEEMFALLDYYKIPISE